MPKSRRPLYALLLIQLLNGIALMPAGSFISIYLNETMAFSVQGAAQVMAFGQVVGMIASLAGGGLSDRWGAKRVLLLGIAATALSMSVYIFRAPWFVVLLWGLSGVGLGFATLSGQSYLTLAASASALGTFSALYNWGYTIGGAVGNPIAALVLEQADFRALGFVLMGFGILTTVLAIFLPGIAPAEKPSSTDPRPGGYQALLQPRLLMLGLLRFLPTCYYGVMMLLPLMIKRQGGSNTAVAWYATGSAVIASLAQLLAGRVSDRWGVRLPTVIAFSLILVAIAGTIITAPLTVWGLYIFGTIGVSAAWVLSTLLPGMVTYAAEAEIRGRVFGALHMLWTLAMILGTLLGGALLERDLRLPFLIVGALNLLALGLTFPFFKTRPGKTTDQFV